MKRRNRELIPVLLCVVMFLTISAESNAQDPVLFNRWGIGVLAGPTSGITVEKSLGLAYQTRRFQSVELNLSANFDDFLLASLHIPARSSLPDSPLTMFFGPGIFAGYQGKDVFWGPSTNFGAFFVRSNYQVFLQLMPRVQIRPHVQGEFGAAVGLRYII